MTTYSFTEKKRIRKDFGKRPPVLGVPNLLTIQTDSYRDFLQAEAAPSRRADKGLEAALKSVFPIKSHSGNAELEFVNHNLRSGKILMIKDSFGLPVYSFLSTGVHEVRALDVRLFKDSVAEYAKKYHPDVVIILYNADSFGGEMFQFN